MTPPRLSTVQLLAAIAALGADIDASAFPEPPPPPRPRNDDYIPLPPLRREPEPPREPTRDELRAIEKRKRKAAKLMVGAKRKAAR